MSDAPLVLVEIRDGWRLVRLNRPEKLNAFTEDLHRALMAALIDAEADPDCRALLLTGSGRAFSSGQDLGDRIRAIAAGPLDLGRSLETFWEPLIAKIRALPFPVVAAIGGIASGAGLNVALHADLVIAAKGAKLTEPFARIGLVPDAGGTWLLPRLVGRAKANALVYLAETISGEEAERIGLVAEAVEDEHLMARAEAICARLAAGPRATLARIKRAMQASEANDLSAQLAVERELQQISGRHADYAEGLAAFAEKRPPRFS
ncbi:MAG: enoyl-CoA hydratase-related protein [Hyphomicrobiales bacterium]|nr:enoyl-CoA hydratase-related protein [Hyphomicrobiales bacterium]